MPPGSIDFTTFTWPAILRRLRQMQITGGLSNTTSGAAGSKRLCHLTDCPMLTATTLTCDAPFNYLWARLHVTVR